MLTGAGAAGTDPPGTGAPVLEVSDGGVLIGGRPVLRHVDLTVPQGQFVALLGANGSGKSTLVRAVTGLRPLARGRVRLFGTPLADFRDWHRVGFVPQRATAASGVPASVAEVVASGRLTRRRLFRPASRADRAAVAAALDAVGLADRARHTVATLSGGQQQRVLIARALAGQADLLLLDEPTAGVDLDSQEALARTLQSVSDRGATVVLVAHELGPLAGLVDRAVVLRDGRVVHDGAPMDPFADAAHALEHPGHAGHAGDGHHHPEPARHDHAPHVASPFEDPSPGSHP